MVAHQAPLSMEVPRQEYWSRLPFPSSGDRPSPGIEPVSLVSPALAGRNSLPLCLLGSLLFLKSMTHTPPSGLCSGRAVFSSPGTPLLQMQTWLPPSPSGLCLNVTFSARPSWTLHIKSPHPAPWPSLSSPVFILPLGRHAWHSLCFAYLLSIWPPSTPRGSRPGAAWSPVWSTTKLSECYRRRGAAEFTHVLLQ